jgi:hypothetical protein
MYQQGPRSQSLPLDLSGTHSHTCPPTVDQTTPPCFGVTLAILCSVSFIYQEGLGKGICPRNWGSSEYKERSVLSRRQFTTK